MTTTPKSDLTSLMNFIGERLPFTQEEYPGIDLSSDDLRRSFAVRHGETHLMKSVGKIAAQAEAADHGVAMDYSVIKKTTASLLVTVLNLAKELGMGSEELAFEIAQSLNKP